MDRRSNAMRCKMVYAVIPSDGTMLKEMADQRKRSKLLAGEQAETGCASRSAEACSPPLRFLYGQIGERKSTCRDHCVVYGSLGDWATSRSAEAGD